MSNIIYFKHIAQTFTFPQTMQFVDGMKTEFAQFAGLSVI